MSARMAGYQRRRRVGSPDSRSHRRPAPLIRWCAPHRRPPLLNRRHRWGERTQHVTGAADRDEQPAMSPQLLSQAMDVNIKRSILGIELSLEDGGDELFASDDRARRRRQARKDLVLDGCQREHRPVDSHPPRGGFEDHASNRLHGHFPHGPPAGGDGRVSCSGRLGEVIIANLPSLRC